MTREQSIVARAVLDQLRLARLVIQPAHCALLVRFKRAPRLLAVRCAVRADSVLWLARRLANSAPTARPASSLASSFRVLPVLVVGTWRLLERQAVRCVARARTPIRVRWNAHLATTAAP